MLTVDKDNTIHLTRGDTARLQIDRATNTVTKKDYIFTANDTVKFTIKKTAIDSSPTVQITVPGGEAIHIKPEDTVSLAAGKYVYDVKLTTAEGDVYTVVELATFEVTKGT